ncbi:GNAT family N-acetyltransferase [Cerasicoccus frondis]|uniref:GNAT family N-acetyltransferase n=1 Tax=Cerasicoccus frondis TaxID=490090 RepID=UPI002852799C|nr:GNAT family N-acetyltransferase [Cerasicoccus frondis]
MDIRQAQPSDEDAMWEIFQRVVAAGDSYVFPPDSDRELFRKQWMSYGPLVAVDAGQLVGTYIIKANQIGLGDHIANGSYMVHPDHHGKGIGKRIGEHSLRLAKERGFRGMQFNIVVSTNVAAVALWQKLGFEIIGTTPRAFRHPQFGDVDTHIMFKSL